MAQVLDSTPIAMLTVGQLREVIQPQNLPTPEPPIVEGRRYVYGLRGIRKMFGVCHATAQKYKDTFLAPAISQNGRKIIVDADLAMELFNQKGEGK